MINASVPDGEFFLGQVHKELFGYHEKNLTAAGEAEKVRDISPLFAVLSYWDVQSLGFGGGVHSTRIGQIPGQQVPVLALQPFEGLPIFVANEAFGSLRDRDGSFTSAPHGAHGWAETSLVMAEEVLTSHFNVPPPTWLESTIYAKYVKFPNGTALVV